MKKIKVKHTNNKLIVTESTGNVFKDLDLPNSDLILKKVKKGLKQSAKGKVKYKGSFAKYTKKESVLTRILSFLLD